LEDFDSSFLDVYSGFGVLRIHFSSFGADLFIKASTCQSFVGFYVLPRSLKDHMVRESWSGRLAVPVNGYEVIPDILLIEAGLVSSHFVLVFRPETR
jgi:hypothetical protein